jgi:hypothetical protein
MTERVSRTRVLEQGLLIGERSLWTKRAAEERRTKICYRGLSLLCSRGSWRGHGKDMSHVDMSLHTLRAEVRGGRGCKGPVRGERVSDNPGTDTEERRREGFLVG